MVDRLELAEVADDELRESDFFRLAARQTIARGNFAPLLPIVGLLLFGQLFLAEVRHTLIARANVTKDDQVGIDNLDKIGAETLMWGSDFPHPDGTWPDSRAFIERQFADVPAAARAKILRENAARIYGFALS